MRNEPGNIESQAKVSSQNLAVKEKPSNTKWVAAIAVLSAVIIGFGILNFKKQNIGPFSDEENAQDSGEEPTNPPPGTEAESVDAEPPSDEELPSSETLEAKVNEGPGPWVVANQDDFKFLLTGVVPSQESKDAIEKSMDETYKEFGVSKLEVDPSLPEPKWVAGLPKFLKVQTFSVIDGAFAVNDSKLFLTGEVANELDFKKREDSAANLGFPPIESETIISNLKDPYFSITSKDGIVTLAGVLPNQKAIDTLEAGAVEVFSVGSVVNEIEIDEETFIRFPIVNFDDNIRTYAPFGDFETGVVNNQSYAQIADGITFEPDSAELTKFAKNLLVGVPPLANRSGRDVQVIGHTDNTGTPEDNLKLSQDRARAVADFLAQHDLPRERIKDQGKGENEQIAENNTEEGKAKNRRVQIIVGEVTDLTKARNP